MSKSLEKSPIKQSAFTINLDQVFKPVQVTVKFHVSDSITFTQARLTQDTIQAIKDNFVYVFNIPFEDISILKNGEVLQDFTTIRSIPMDSYGIVELDVVCKDVDNFVKRIKNNQNFVVPDIITVKVDDGDQTKEVVVEIENRAIEKPQLGGYKDIRTGVNYFHGYSQTGPPPPKVPPDQKNHRDTQTYFTRNRKCEQSYSRAVQMARSDLYIPSITDTILTAQPYETSEEWEKRLDVEGKIRTIQRYLRAWRIRKSLRELHEEYQKRKRLEEEREALEKREDEARKRRDLVSKVFPITKTDFAMLYTMVERWKTAEMAKITSMHCGASRIAELYLLLEKEIEILRNLEKLRQKVIKDTEVKQVMNFFKSIGKPIEWYSSYKDIHISMDTLETQKGREYFALYKSLVKKGSTNEESIQIYMEIKEYLKKHTCQLSEQIIKLIDRFCQLLTIHRSVPVGLEKRISQMVLQHFKMVECNEGVMDHSRRIKRNKMKDLIYCKRCHHVKPIDKFSIDIKSESVKICHKCKLIDKVEEPWMDLLPHRYILKQIRNYERMHRAISSVAFILQDKDIYHIITYIWHGHSALSECNDIYQLRLCRWRISEDWSPWNCILLTLEEAKAHLKVVNLDEIYEEEFRNHVFNKHALAKKHFAKLMEYDRLFLEATKDNQRLNEDSIYNKKDKPDCLFGDINGDKKEDVDEKNDGDEDDKKDDYEKKHHDDKDDHDDESEEYDSDEL